MPARTALLYLQEKYLHETRRDNYLMDMLWAPATGHILPEAKRYYDITPKPDVRRSREKSSEQIIDETIAKFRGG